MGGRHCFREKNLLYISNSHDAKQKKAKNKLVKTCLPEIEGLKDKKELIDKEGRVENEQL